MAKGVRQMWEGKFVKANVFKEVIEGEGGEREWGGERV